MLSVSSPASASSSILSTTPQPTSEPTNDRPSALEALDRLPLTFPLRGCNEAENYWWARRSSDADLEIQVSKRARAAWTRLMPRIARVDGCGSDHRGCSESRASEGQEVTARGDHGHSRSCPLRGSRGVHSLADERSFVHCRSRLVPLQSVQEQPLGATEE